MPPITLPLELPAIDLGTIVPIIALVMLGALILVTLTAHSLIKSRAFGLGLFALIIIAGSATIVGSLQALAVLIGVAGVVAIGLIVVLGRNPDVIDLLHTARPQTPPQLPPGWDQQPQAQLPPPAGRSASPAVRRSSSRIVRPPDGWGF